MKSKIDPGGGSCGVKKCTVQRERDTQTRQEDEEEEEEEEEREREGREKG